MSVKEKIKREDKKETTLALVEACKGAIRP